VNEVAWGERVDAELGVGDLVPCAPGWVAIEYLRERYGEGDGIVEHDIVGWLRVRTEPSEVAWVPAKYWRNRLVPCVPNDAVALVSVVAKRTNKGENQ